MGLHRWAQLESAGLQASNRLMLARQQGRRGEPSWSGWPVSAQVGWAPGLACPLGFMPQYRRHKGSEHPAGVRQSARSGLAVRASVLHSAVGMAWRRVQQQHAAGPWSQRQRGRADDQGCSQRVECGRRLRRTVLMRLQGHGDHGVLQSAARDCKRRP